MSMPVVPPFTADQVQRVLDEMTSNPYIGRATVMQLLATKNTSKVQQLVRECKAYLGLDPTNRRNHPPKDGSTPAVSAAPPVDTQERLKIDEREGEVVLEGLLPENRYSYAETVPHLLDAAEIDTDKWDVYRKVINRWGSAANPCWQVKAWLKPVEANLFEELINDALQQLRAHSPVVPPLVLEQRDTGATTHRRALEISIMDPHLGGIFYEPASELAWDLEKCARLWHYGVQEVLHRAAPYGPFERILFTLGNDFMHADNVFHTTTAGTGQPEMAALHHVAVFGERMLVDTVNYLAQQVRDVDVLFVPGNHARWTEFMLARVLYNRFHGHSGVHVNADPTPYKGWRYGCNLVGFEHGHSAAVVRLAAVMANEWPQWWAATEGGYREWHIADQHRTGKGKILVYEEQGVSIQGLPGLTPPNEWHKLKTFSRQKRAAAVGFVWDYHQAKYAELPVMLDGATGEPFAHP
jgi:hypothetical protein